MFRAFYDIQLHFLSHSFIYYSGSSDAPQPEASSHTSQHTGDSAAACRTPQVGNTPVLSEKVYTSSAEKRRTTPSLHCFCSDYWRTFLRKP